MNEIRHNWLNYPSDSIVGERLISLLSLFSPKETRRIKGEDLDKPEVVDKSRYAPIWAVLDVCAYAFVLILFILGLNQIIGQNDFSFAGGYANSLREFLSLCACLVAIAIFRRRKTLQFLNEIGIRNKKVLSDLAVGFAVGAVIVSTMLGAMYLAGGYKIESTTWPIDLFPALIMFFLVGLTEELIFRGYVFQTLERGIGTFFAIIISSLLFGFAHSFNQVENVTFMDKLYFCAVLSFEAGLPLVGAYLLKRRLWLPVGIHWAWDFVEGTVFGFNVSGEDIGPSIVNPVLIGDLYTSGGPFGPEASLPAFVIGVASGAIILFLCYKKGRLKFPRSKLITNR